MNLANQSYFTNVLSLQIHLLTYFKQSWQQIRQIFLTNTYSASIRQRFSLPEFCVKRYIKSIYIASI